MSASQLHTSSTAMYAASTSVGITQTPVFQVPCFLLPPPNPFHHVPATAIDRQEHKQPATWSGCTLPKTGRTVFNPCVKRDDEEDSVVSLVEKVETVFSTPTPGISPSLALGYPLALGAGLIFLPISSSFVSTAFFCLYAYLGRSLVLDEMDDLTEDETESDLEESRPKTDLFAFAAAVLSAGLLSPDIERGTGGSHVNVLLALAVGGCALGYFFFGGVTLDPPIEEAMTSTMNLEEDIMSKWDNKLKKGGRDDNTTK